MVENMMVWLFHTSKTLQNFVDCHIRLGDEVDACFFVNCTLVHDLRPRILHFFSKNWLFVT